MNLAFGIILLVVSVLSVAVVIGMFVWGAIKDGQDNDAVQGRIQRRRWPR